MLRVTVFRLRYQVPFRVAKILAIEAGSPSSVRVFWREVGPVVIVMLLFGMFRVLASKVMRALLALPFSGTAVTRVHRVC